MQLIAICCFALTPAQYPDEVYKGPAYADFNGKQLLLTARVKAAMLVGCVHAGLTPARVKCFFGPPLLQSRFRAGPIEWWYPELGVIAYFPARAFPPVQQYARIRGGIQ
jgi:hypothetical protein